MKFDVTLAVVLAFLVPGGILIWFLPPAMTETIGVISVVDGSASALQLAVLLCEAFVAGVIIDSLRTVSLQPVIKIIARKIDKEGLPGDYVSHITATRLPVFEMLIGRSYEYYRLNCNLSVALLAATVLNALTSPFGMRGLVLIVSFALAFVISLRSKLDNDAAIRQFVASDN